MRTRVRLCLILLAGVAALLLGLSRLPRPRLPRQTHPRTSIPLRRPTRLLSEPQPPNLSVVAVSLLSGSMTAECRVEPDSIRKALLRFVVPRDGRKCSLCDAARLAVGGGPRRLLLTTLDATHASQLALLQSFLNATAAVRIPVLVLVSTTGDGSDAELDATTSTAGGLAVVAALPGGGGVAQRKWLALSELLEAGFEVLYADVDVVLTSGKARPLTPGLLPRGTRAASRRFPTSTSPPHHP